MGLSENMGSPNPVVYHHFTHQNDQHAIDWVGIQPQHSDLNPTYHSVAYLHPIHISIKCPHETSAFYFPTISSSYPDPIALSPSNIIPSEYTIKYKLNGRYIHHKSRYHIGHRSHPNHAIPVSNILSRYFQDFLFPNIPMRCSFFPAIPMICWFSRPNFHGCRPPRPSRPPRPPRLPRGRIPRSPGLQIWSTRYSTWGFHCFFLGVFVARNQMALHLDRPCGKWDKQLCRAWFRTGRKVVYCGELMLKVDTLVFCEDFWNLLGLLLAGDYGSLPRRKHIAAAKCCSGLDFDPTSACPKRFGMVCPLQNLGSFSQAPISPHFMICCHLGARSVRPWRWVKQLWTLGSGLVALCSCPWPHFFVMSLEVQRKFENGPDIYWQY